MTRLEEKYKNVVAPALIKEFGIENKMAIPRLAKVVVNMGVGKISGNKELSASLSRDLAAICGQVPSLRRAKVSIASFNLRRGMPVGLAVTLRGERMFNFLDKLFSIVLPRLRDFKGVSLRGLDSQGNYSLGISEYTVFPEVDPGKTPAPAGLEMTIVTSAKDRQRAKRLLELLGMPFEKA